MENGEKKGEGGGRREGRKTNDGWMRGLKWMDGYLINRTEGCIEMDRWMDG